MRLNSRNHQIDPRFTTSALNSAPHMIVKVKNEVQIAGVVSIVGSRVFQRLCVDAASGSIPEYGEKVSIEQSDLSLRIFVDPKAEYSCIAEILELYT